MEETYEEYEEKCREIRRQNEELLKLFESDMASLSPKTIQKHLDNVDFYINNYLLREDALTMENGVAYLDSFLGYFFYTQVHVVNSGYDKGHSCQYQKVL